MKPFKENIIAIRPWLSSKICGERQFEMLIEASSKIPLLPTGALEFRLNGNSSDVDFGALAIYKENEFQRILDYYDENSQDSERPEWLDIIRSIDFSLKKNILLPGSVQNCWISFDLSNEGQLIPFIFLGMGRFPKNLDFKLLTCEEVLSAQEKELTSQEEILLFSILSNLPENSNSFLTFIGHLQPRGLNLLRTTLFWDGSFQRFLRYLKQINWPGDLSHYYEDLEILFVQSHYIQFTIDFADVFQPWIAIEFWPDIDNNKGNSEIIFDIFIKMGFCNTQLKAIHLEWIHHPNQQKYGLKRWLNHFKLTFRPKQEVQSKIYYGFSNHLQNNSH